MKKNKQREVPKKNYVYVGLLTIATCLALVYCVKWYRLREQEQVTRTISITSATEIKADEFDAYLLENPDVILYISNSTDEKLTGFENTFENYLHSRELTNKLLYLDTSLLTETSRKQVENKLFSNSSLVEPNFIIMQEGNKVGQLYYNASEIKLNDVHQFLTQYEVVE